MLAITLIKLHHNQMLILPCELGNQALNPKLLSHLLYMGGRQVKRSTGTFEEMLSGKRKYLSYISLKLKLHNLCFKRQQQQKHTQKTPPVQKYIMLTKIFITSMKIILNILKRTPTKRQLALVQSLSRKRKHYYI